MKSAMFGALALAFLSACSKGNIDTQEAVKQGVINDLAKSKNINMSSMDISVVSVSFRDKEADAVVSFAPKGGNAAQGLTMNYTMERQGTEWHIKSRSQGDMQKHAAQGQQMQPGTQLPPGHPQ